MFTISSDAIAGVINIYDNFTDINSPVFNKKTDNYTLSFINLKGVKSFNTFTFTTSGENNYRYLTAQYRISKDNKSWTKWLPLYPQINNFPPFDHRQTMFIDIKWVRDGDSNLGTINLLSYNLGGTVQRNVVEILDHNANVSNSNSAEDCSGYSSCPPPNYNPDGAGNVQPIPNKIIISVTGIQGPQGNFGPQGNVGYQGFQGIQGLQGTQGIQGYQGFQGMDGTYSGYYLHRISGSFSGNSLMPYIDNTLYYDVLFPSVFNWNYVVNIESEAVRAFSVDDKTINGFRIYTNSITPINDVIYWEADDLSTGDFGIIIGPQGLNGTQGVQGIQGLQGVQGFNGFRGLQGFKGSQGTQGVQGNQGFIGEQGVQGNQGFIGEQGAQGTQGSQGNQGLNGLDGFQGSQGVQGLNGLDGFQGSQGVQGLDGFQGSQGVQGLNGLDGFQGSQGNQGLNGLDGFQGSQGLMGVQGAQGFGLQGSQGAQGLNGFQGVQGSIGVQGSQGVIGAQGSQGVIGVQGSQGVIGVQGNQGFQGIGFQGAQGFTGTASSLSGLTAGYIVKASSSSNIINSQLFDNGVEVGIGTVSPATGYKLDVNGRLKSLQINIGTSNNLNSTNTTHIIGESTTIESGASYVSILGGFSNTAKSTSYISSISGGSSNIVDGTNNNIGTSVGINFTGVLGQNNYAVASNNSLIFSGTGSNNRLIGANGCYIDANKGYNIVMGYNIYAQHNGNFMLGDLASIGAGYLNSTTDNQFVSRFQNGYSFRLANNVTALTINSSGQLSVGTITPSVSSILDLTSTTRGFLQPRMTTTQQNAISSPASGLSLYNNSINQISFYNGAAWVQAWTTRGNSGTNPVNDFIGTTDAAILNFRQNNQPVGLIDVAGGFRLAIGYYASYNNTQNYNTAFGHFAMFNSTTGGGNSLFGASTGEELAGDGNQLFGYDAGKRLTNASWNVAIGYQAFRSKPGSWNHNVAIGYQSQYNASGSHNISIGLFSLYNVTGLYNIGIGTQAGETITSGSYNISLGHQTNKSLTTAEHNIAFGYQTRLNAVAGDGNVAIGRLSMTNQTAGDNNVGIGPGTLYQTSRSNQVAIGVNALYSNTTGYSNIAIGYFALSTNSLGNDNTAIGSQTGQVSTGSGNSFYGSLSGYGSTTGNNNTAIGFQSGFAIAGGSSNVFVGSAAANSQTAGDNNISIGYNQQLPSITGSNQINIGGVIFASNANGSANAPSGQVSIGVNLADVSSVVDITSTTKGVLLPRMTNTQILAISTPQNGLLVYNTDLNKLCIYEAGTWSRVNTSAM